MPAFKDLTGQKFGRLVAIKPIRNSGKNVKWFCACDCGNTSSPYAFSLLSGDTKSCGCLGKERRLKAHKKHGMCDSRVYSCWEHMKARCNNKNFKQYKDYGGRGIKVCDEWEEFEKFYKWAMDNGYDDNLTLDRLDVNGNYCPENCRWVTRKEQQLNRRVNKVFTFNGETLTQKEWSDKLGFCENLIIGRLKRGWTIEEALTIPASNKKRISKIRKESTKAPVSATSCLPVEQCLQETE